MVSPFMAFARGALEGYNDKVAQQAQFEHEENLQRIRNEGKATIDAPEQFEIYGENTTYKLFDMPPKEAYGSEGERRDAILERFYNATSVVDPAYGMTIVDYLQQNDEFAYNNLLSSHDLLAHQWVTRNSSKDTGDTQMRYRKGEVFSLSQDHIFGERFKDIARGELPMGNIDDIIVNYDALDGSYLDRHTFNPELYGYENKNIFLEAILKLNKSKGLGGTGAKGIDPYLNAYADPGYWAAYKDLDETFQVIRAQGGWLDIDSKQKIFEVINSQRHGPFFHKLGGGLDVKKLHKLMTLGGGQGAHILDAGPQDVYRLVRPDVYVKRVLGYEKGMDPIRQRVSAAEGAIFTIDKILSLYPNFNKRLDGAGIGDSHTGDLYVDEIRKEGGGWKDGLLKKNPDGTVDIGKIFTGLPAAAVSFIEGLLGEDGGWDQVKDIVSGAGFDFGGPNGERVHRSQFMKRISDSAGRISVRKLLTEVLVYQVATALQGGTGGRTISDQDVLRISRAIGEGLLWTTPRLQVIRMRALRGSMMDVLQANSSFGESRTVEQMKGADLVNQYVIGQRLGDMTNSQVVTYIKSQFQGVPKDEEVTGIGLSTSMKFGNYKISNIRDIVPHERFKLGDSPDTEIDGKAKYENLTETQIAFLELEKNEQNDVLRRFYSFISLHGGSIEKPVNTDEDIFEHGM